MGAWKKNLLKRYYLFNVNGECIGEFTKGEMLEKFNIKECTLCSALKRISVILGKYYVSNDKNFKLPNPKPYSHNPIFSKHVLSYSYKDFKQMNVDFLLEYEIGIFNQQYFLLYNIIILYNKKKISIFFKNCL